MKIPSPTEAKDSSSSPCVRTGFGAHSASCSMGIGVLFPGGEAWRRRNADRSPHLVPRSKMSRSYFSSPPSASMACGGIALLYLTLLGFWTVCPSSDILKKKTHQTLDKVLKPSDSKYNTLLSEPFKIAYL
jgi:hypothetical protein